MVRSQISFGVPGQAVERWLAACFAISIIGALGCVSPASKASTEQPSEVGEAISAATRPADGAPAPTSGSPSEWLAAAEQALRDDEPARAAALFARVLGQDPSGELARQAYPGLARAHEQLGDFEAAIRAYDSFLRHFAEDPRAPVMLARRGACEAEIGQWERSAASYQQVLERGDELLPSERVEALARQGYAMFHLDRLDEADALFAAADEVFTSATESGAERFADTYFGAMARFYRAAILHRRFRAIEIHLPEQQMQEDFAAKLELLEQAQEAYNHAIRARHVYWVSAAGYQLSTLFEEFYDAVMYAPVPDWLDEAQRRVYYEELEEQLRPVVDKAIWVLEKNLETARKLGYENEFVQRSEDQLARLQGVLLGRDARLGQPMPRLTPGDSSIDEDGAASEASELPAIERKLFVPLPTTL